MRASVLTCLFLNLSLSSVLSLWERRQRMRSQCHLFQYVQWSIVHLQGRIQVRSFYKELSQWNRSIINHFLTGTYLPIQWIFLVESVLLVSPFPPQFSIWSSLSLSSVVNECADDTADCSPLSDCTDLPDGYMCRYAICCASFISVLRCQLENEWNCNYLFEMQGRHYWRLISLRTQTRKKMLWGYGDEWSIRNSN